MALIHDQGTSGIPLGPPPPGISPNFVDPQTLAPVVLTFSIVMMTIAVLFVVIRLYGNFRAPRGLRIEDCRIFIFHLAHSDILRL